MGCQPLAGESMRWIKDTVSGLGNPHDAAAKNRVGKVRPVRGPTTDLELAPLRVYELDMMMPME